MSTMTTEAIRKTVLVDFAPAEAFELFTTRVSSWWPTETHSYAHDKVTDVDLRAPGRRAAVRGDRRGHGRVGQDHGLGAAASPRAGVADRQGLRHRGRSALLPEGPGSRVELEHRGWERVPDATDEYQGYTHGWDAVLAPYIETRSARRRRRSAPRAGRRAGARRRARGAGAARTAPRRRRAPPASTSGWRSRTRMRAAPRVNTGAGSKAGVRSR